MARKEDASGLAGGALLDVWQRLSGVDQAAGRHCFRFARRLSAGVEREPRPHLSFEDELLKGQ